MDTPALFFPLQNQPVIISEQTLVLRGAFAPILVPMAGLSPEQRAYYLVRDQTIALDVRVHAALVAHKEPDAWGLIRRAAPRELQNAGLNAIMSQWVANEIKRIQLPQPKELITLLSAQDHIRRSIDVALATNSVREMFSGLMWPRWWGTCIVIVGDMGNNDPYPGIAQLARPALPILRMAEKNPGLTNSEMLCVLLTDLTLQLEIAPNNGWPVWLQVGLREVAQAKMRGEGPSPLKMQHIRQAAGVAGIQQLLLAAEPDRATSMAVCAYMVHSRRRHLLANYLDLLRGGSSADGAFRIAYGVTIEQLLSER
jgi:hypothetical protein